MRHRIGPVPLLALAATLLAFLPSRALAVAGFSISADVGFGNSHLESATGTSVTSWGIGLGMPLGPAQWIELRSTGTGSPFDHGVSGPEPGGRSVQTLTGGIKLAPAGPLGIFATGGLGVGRAEIASRRTTTTFVAGREHTGLGFTVGAGYRFTGLAGPLGLEVAWRMHGLLEKDFSSSDFARLVTVGLHF